MNIKIIQHIMPWDIDYSHLFFIRLKEAKWYNHPDVDITVETVLNLSDYVFDWKESKIPKEFFIQKYNAISQLLIDYKHIKRIYEGNDLYGHLDFQKECISKETDYYIGTCPDMHFDPIIIPFLIQSLPNIKNKYFVITPQISKMWDVTWDELVDPWFAPVPYDKWDEVDVFTINQHNELLSSGAQLDQINKSKFAGWFDVYNKAFYEELCPFLPEWKGYGPWDWYAMMISDHCKQKGVDFQQYILKGQTIFQYDVGPLKEQGFHKYYKNMLVLNNIPNQRQQFESKMSEYLDKQVKQLKEKGILC